MVPTPTNGVAPEPNIRRSLPTERLDRISKYRIRSTAIMGATKPGTRGGNAEVVRANLKRNRRAHVRRVAVKKLLWSNTTDEKKISNGFVHEVELLTKLSHKNIVQLIGFVEDLKQQKAWIVLSWQPNGNVREFLASGEWQIPERISLIQDMFRGLQYLHTRESPVCHGDLKSLNILVSSSYRAIITDFGSARLINNKSSKQINVRDGKRISTIEGRSNNPEVTIIASANHLTVTGPAWSLRWAAPEVVMEVGLPDLASDIWSAGWVCWEMMTDKVPFEDYRRYSAIVLKVVQGTVPSIHEDAQLAQVVALCNLMSDCWKFEPENRPHVTQCYREVEWMPSVLPLGGTPSGAKKASPRLLLEMAFLHYSHDRHEKASSLLEQVVADAKFARKQEVAQALHQLGDVYRAQCRYTEAEESYMRAQELHVSTGNDQGQANTIVGLGDLYYTQCRYPEAEDFYSRAQEIHARIEDDQGQANTLDGLGCVYHAQCRHTEAEESYTLAQDIYARIGDDRGRANAIRGLGHIYRAQSRHTKAKESYTRAQEIYARIGDDQGRANTILGLGHVHYAQCRFIEAGESYARAQEIHTGIGDNHGRASALRGLGDVYSVQGRHTEAKEFFTRAKGIYTRIGNEQGRANTVLGLGSVFRAQCRYTEAEEAYIVAQEIHARIGHEQGRANAIRGLGDVFYGRCRYPEAEESYMGAQEIHARIGDDHGRASTIRGLGDVYRARCQYTEAEEYYMWAQEIYSRIGDERGRANAELGLGEVYRARCEYAKAEAFFTRASHIYFLIGDTLGRANTLRGRAHIHRVMNRRVEAVELYAQARNLYSQIGNSRDEDNASYWLALIIISTLAHPRPRS